MKHENQTETSGPRSLQDVVMPHSCDCKNYNGGQCYNCLNGFHRGCDGRCKKPNARRMGLRIVYAAQRRTERNRRRAGARKALIK
jgi:hypothetical protein